MNNWIRRFVAMALVAFGLGCCTPDPVPGAFNQLLRIDPAAAPGRVPETVVLEVREIKRDELTGTAAVILAYGAMGTKRIVLKINSGGGMVADGIAFSQFIEGLPLPVICVVDRQAASMAVFVLEACDKRFIVAGGTIVAHEPQLVIDPEVPLNQRALEQKLALIKEIALLMSAVITARTTVTPEEYRWNLQETGIWEMSADEALDLGFVDGVVDPLDVPATTKLIEAVR